MFQNADGSFNFDDDHVTHTETGEKVSKFVYGSVNFNVSVTYGLQVKNGVFIIFFSDRTSICSMFHEVSEWQLYAYYLNDVLA